MNIAIATTECPDYSNLGRLDLLFYVELA